MRWGLAAVLAALVLAAPAAAGSSFTDPTGDSGTAADIVSVTVSNDTNGQYTFVVGFASDYVGNDNMGIYLDTDRNPNTGDANASGADYSISDDRASQTFELDKWDGSQWTAAAEGSFTLSVSSDHRSVTASVNKADLGGATSFNFYVGSYDGNGGAGHYDDAPSGSGTFE
jgi:hypothetical protein